MVLLEIRALNERGESALLKVLNTKTRGLAKMSIAQDTPMVVHIEYGKHLQRFLNADSSLRSFALSRGVQMGEEAMIEAGAVKGDFVCEVRV